ncbi:hypothetical protein DHEL01_v210414 [Diaporthe helianthi]|uniref:RBR-type E3 ubiquitin transferase n=1 Tax=Diaporthe helianthi TaxID=158607 RepID=A0A2P5HLT4_DIAHE|nr:hypothetical protein DHEL01_v210414 [Diaporthe helianthi]
MSSNDGKQLLVFGLTFAQHDNRKMQQVLRHYEKLPDNPGSRVSLFVQLNKVAKELMADEVAQEEVKQLTDWMKKGGESGDFPLGVAPAPAPAPANSGAQTASARGAGIGSQPNLTVGVPRFIRGDYGRGRALNGQQSSANQTSRPPAQYPTSATRLGRKYGRGRTIGGDWDGNQDQEEREGDNNREDDAQGMDADQDDDQEMYDEIDPFLFMPRGLYGPGRTFSGPQEEPRATAAVDEGGPSRSGHAEGQDIHDDLTDDDELSANHLEDPALERIMMHWKDSLVENNDQPDDGQEIECPICLEDYPRSKFPKRATVTEFCDHPDRACLNCLDSSITAIIERGALHLLACPICPQRLSPRNIKEYASPTVYKRYKYLKEQSEIPGHYISCTNPVCGGSQPHEIEDPMMICNHCQFATCAKHRRPWHEGQTCEEFDLDDAQVERLEEEEATAKLLAGESLSICPKCGQGVTKSDGCDHMQCQCGQSWCYVCSCSYENIIRLGPSAHATFCTYHPNKVSLTKSQREAARSRIMGLVHGGEVSAELSRARDELRRRRHEEIRAKAAEAVEDRMRLQREQNRDQEAAQGKDGQPEKKKRKVKLVAPWEEGGLTKKAFQ